MRDSLQHYGIKGMKWGVRRTPEQLGHVRKSRKPKYGYVGGQSYDKDIEFPKGTVGYRVQAKPGLKNGPLYLSYSKSDHLRNLSTAIDQPDYGIAPDAWNFETGEVSLYSVKLKAKESIRAPSYIHAMETFVDMVGDIGVDKINPYSPQCNYGRNFIENWKKRGKFETGASYAYTKFVDTMGRDTRSKFYEEFKKRLIDRGYNALVDPEDRPAILNNETGYGGDGWEDKIAKAPFIILDPKRTLQVDKQTKLTKADQDYVTRFYDIIGGSLEETDRYIAEWPSANTPRYKRSHKRWKQMLND